MKKLAVALLVIIGVVAGTVLAARQSHTDGEPKITWKNYKDAPAQITGVVISDDKYTATLQFDESGSWNAYAIRWTRTYGPDHKMVSYYMFDRALTKTGFNSNSTFAPHDVDSHTGMMKDIDKIKDGSTMKAAEVELVWAIKYDGTTWGDTAAGLHKQPDGTEDSPYLTILQLRQQK